MQIKPNRRALRRNIQRGQWIHNAARLLAQAVS